MIHRSGKCIERNLEDWLIDLISIYQKFSSANVYSSAKTLAMRLPGFHLSNVDLIDGWESPQWENRFAVQVKKRPPCVLCCREVVYADLRVNPVCTLMTSWAVRHTQAMLVTYWQIFTLISLEVLMVISPQSKLVFPRFFGHSILKNWTCAYSETVNLPETRMEKR